MRRDSNIGMTEDEKDTIKRFSSVFGDTSSRCTKMIAKLYLKENAKLVFRSKRPFPFSAKQSAVEEFYYRHPTQNGPCQMWLYECWMAAFVFMPIFPLARMQLLKMTTIRFPLLMVYLQPSMGGTCFANLDLSETYLQVKYYPECREYPTINTQECLYQFALQRKTQSSEKSWNLCKRNSHPHK